MIWAVSLLAFTTCSARTTDLERVIPNWTGQNGYEEYVRAAMFIDKPENQALESYVRWLESPSGFSKPPERPSAIPEGADLLATYRVEVKQFEPALDLIRQGNGKTVSYPDKPYTPATLFPELSRLKIAGRVFAREAYVEFAAGHHREATDAIVAGLTLSKKIQVAGLISYLVGRAIAGFIAASVQRHLTDLSIDDARRISEWCSKQGDPREAVFAATVKDWKSYRTAFDEYCANPKPYLADDIHAWSLGKITDVLKKATPEWKEQVYAATLKKLEAPWAAMAEVAKHAEPEWFRPLEYDRSGSPKPPQEPQDAVIAITPLFTILQNLSGDPGPDLPLTFLRAFIRERLLRIHCDIVLYRWQNGKLPTTLADVYGTEPIDPATREKYVFKIQEGGKFTVLCHTDKLGDVGLVASGR